MNRVMLALLFFGVQLATAQSEKLLDRIALDMNKALEGSRLRGRMVAISVSVRNGTYQLGLSEGDRMVKEAVDRVLAGYTYSFSPEGGEYNCWIYFDAYSDKVYTTFFRPPVFGKGMFADYFDSYPNPNGGMLHWMNTIYSDFYRHRRKVDSVNVMGGFPKLAWLIDTTGAAQLIQRGPLDQYLDSVLRIRSSPGVYYGRLMPAIVRMAVDRKSVTDGKIMAIDSYDEPIVSRALPDTYQGKWVRLEEDRNQAEGKLVVSFVFNPATLRLEHPLIHRGAPGDAGGFIDWLNKQEWQPNLFYWRDYPKAGRSYFCLD